MLSAWSLVVRPLIGMLALSAIAPALLAEVYDSMDPSGNPRYTNVKAEAKGCKLLNVLPPATEASAQSERAVAAAPVTPRTAELSSRAAATGGEPAPGARLQALEDWARGSRATL